MAISVFGSTITFSGESTTVTNENGQKTVNLTGGAKVQSDNIGITSEKVSIWSEEYEYVRCTGNVVIEDSERQITLKSSNAFYDRNKKLLLADGNVELEDKKNNAKIGGMLIEYNRETSVISIQMKARLTQETEKGLLNASSDVITYNADFQTLTMNGNSNINWGEDRYLAKTIILNIETEEISLGGSVTGEIIGI